MTCSELHTKIIAVALRVTICVTACLLTSASVASAEPHATESNRFQSIAAVPSDDSFIGPIFVMVGPPEPIEIRLSPTEKLERSWRLTSEALDQSLVDPGARSQVIEQLEMVAERMKALDLRSAEQWSLTLIQTAEAALAAEDFSYAAALVSWADRLSPHSAEVALRAVRVSHLSGYKSFLAQVLNVSSRMVSDRAAQFSFLASAIYPLLWGLTISLYILMVLTLALGMNAPLRFVGLKSYQRLRGVISPVVVLAVLVLPILAGPLWALLAWGLILLAVLPRRRWVALYAGVLIGLWGALIPIRESLNFNLACPRIALFVRASTGQFELGDVKTLRAAANEYQGSAEVNYVLGIALRRVGNLEAAREAFVTAQAIWEQRDSSNRRLAVAQLGLLDYMNERYADAEAKLREAQDAGLGGAEMTLNLAKVVFARLQIDQSLALTTEAEKSWPGMTLDLRQREERFGDRSPLALAEFPLPTVATLAAALDPGIPLEEQVRVRAVAAAEAMMWGASPLVIAALGALLCLLFLVQGAPPRRVRKEILYAAGVPSRPLRLLIRLIPGGTSLWTGLPGVALTLLTVAVFAVMPFVGWPVGAIGLFEVAPSVKPLLGSFLGLWLIGTVYIGWHLKEREE